MSALVLLGALVASALPVLPVSAAPASRTPGRTIETFSRYEPQTTCNPVAKPGVVAFMRMTLRAYPGTGTSGIVRACSIGARSEHKEGRAWEWTLSVANPRQRQQASDMMTWLLATDAFGNRRAQARRLGVMYVIWDRKIWSSTAPEAGWQPYAGPDSHTTHMHFSFSVLGAQGRTSFWTGSVPAGLLPPVSVPTPLPAPIGPVETGPETGAPTGATAGGAAPTDRPVLDTGSAEVEVPASGDSTTTPFSLRAGRRYLLTATGTYHYGSGDLVADAECSRRPDGGWRTTSAWEGEPGRGHLDLQVAREGADWTPVTDTGRGCDTGGHAYTRTVLPIADGPLVVHLDDDVTTDNAGGLTLRVSVLDATVPTD